MDAAIEMIDRFNQKDGRVKRFMNFVDRGIARMENIFYSD